MANGCIYIECPTCEERVFLGKYWVSSFEIRNQEAVEEFLRCHCCCQIVGIKDDCTVENLKLRFEE
jgi:hypothetical protein